MLSARFQAYFFSGVFFDFSLTVQPFRDQNGGEGISKTRIFPTCAQGPFGLFKLTSAVLLTNSVGGNTLGIESV